MPRVYAYANNNPIAFNDPTGEAEREDPKRQLEAELDKAAEEIKKIDEKIRELYREEDLINGRKYGRQSVTGRARLVEIQRERRDLQERYSWVGTRMTNLMKRLVGMKGANTDGHGGSGGEGGHTTVRAAAMSAAVSGLTMLAIAAVDSQLHGVDFTESLNAQIAAPAMQNMKNADLMMKSLHDPNAPWWEPFVFGMSGINP
ncbi:MAG: hypothetical protein QM820_31240 [Minicystis sp.]